MKCELIFYLAGRTGQLEELLEELLGGLGVIIAEVTAATSRRSWRPLWKGGIPAESAAGSRRTVQAG